MPVSPVHLLIDFTPSSLCCVMTRQCPKVGDLLIYSLLSFLSRQGIDTHLLGLIKETELMSLPLQGSYVIWVFILHKHSVFVFMAEHFSDFMS
jgi:hypothetical protein